jgi:hypothetical protein
MMRGQRRGKQKTLVEARANAPLDALIPLEMLVRELQALQDSLVEAQRHEVYRDRLSGSLIAVLKFVQAIPEWDSRNLWAPLLALAVGLEELKYGTVAPFLCPEKFPNRHPHPSSRKMIRVMCAWYAEALMSAGAHEMEACAFVAEILTAQGFQLSDLKFVRAETVANWRSDIPKLPTDDLQVQVLTGLRKRPNPFRTLEEVRKWVQETLPILYRDLGYAAD